MISRRSQLISLIEQGVIPAEKIGAAVIATEIAPNGERWRSAIDQCLLILAGVALALAGMFFIAYNWADLGRFAKFGGVQGFMVLAIAAYCKFDNDSTAGKVALLAATIGLGVLLALTGQTYQTGADPWQLFFYWALLMVPWAVVARFPALWIVWAVLMNVSIFLYYQPVRGDLWFLWNLESAAMWPIFVFNVGTLAAWEYLAKTRQWLLQPWAIRTLATGAGICITALVLFDIFDGQGNGDLTRLTWLVWMGAMYYFYRKRTTDLFMLAGSSVSGITVTTSFIAYSMSVDSINAFLYLALLVVGMGAGSAVWLKSVNKELQS